ncbi:MAG: hypothetical protein E7052_00175 [Lentisphaerae bacterium]|nr:hypothetical protein [Lentisphaerota bacterium]
MKSKLYGLILALLMLAMAGAGAGDFTLQEKNGSFAITFRDRELISESLFTIDGKNVFKPGELTVEKKQLADGSTAFNIWSKDPQRRYRQEGVISADGKRLELNMQFDYLAYSPAEGKVVEYILKMPFKPLAGCRFEAVHGRNMRPVWQKGVIAADLKGNLTADRARMLTIKLPEGDVLLDFSPQGVCNYAGATGNTCIGMWQVARMKEDPEVLSLAAIRKVPAWGGGIAGKVVITAGSSKEYNTYHPRKKYSYYDALPAQKLYSFGAEKVGRKYSKLDLRAAGKLDGWADPGNGKIVAGKHPGAFYSAVAGSGKALLKVKDLQPGYYFVTAGIGNFDRQKNKFSIKVNGVDLAKDITVKAGEAASLTRVFKLDKGVADIEFTGNWRISTLGFQLLSNFYEDYSFSRGFWVTDGFEPGVMYNNSHYAKEPAFATGRTDVVMPDPDKAPAPVKSLVYTVKQPSAKAQENMRWRYTARVSQVGTQNNGTFQEFIQPGAVERRMDELKKENFNLIIVSGLLSRHTYPAHLQRVRRQVKRMAAAAHERGMKFYDHIDYILLWNMDSGFRVAAEKPFWLARELDTLLPTTDFCVNNHERNLAYRKYLKKYIQDTAIDGIMIDEVCFPGGNFCGCGDCREDFTADTAQEWPLNEMAPDQITAKGSQAATALAKTHQAWRRKRVGDWWVELRSFLDKDYPEFGFFCYSTHYGLSSNYASNSLGFDLLQVGRAVDFLGTEIMPRNVWACARPLFSYRKAKNMLRNAFGMPVYGQIYAPGGWDVAYFGWGLMNMNAQVYWAEPPMACPPGKSDYYKFSDRNMDIGKAVSCADVALLFSSQGRDNGVRMNYKVELFGMAQTLGEMHVNYDIICDTVLSLEQLKKYKVLWVGASAPLSDNQIAIIRKFAEQGGHVVLGPIAAVANEYGQMRDKWPFEDLFKFKPASRQSKVSRLDLDNGTTVTPAKIIPAWLPDPRNMKMPAAPVTMVWGKTRIPAIFNAPLGKGQVMFMPLAIGSVLVQEEMMVGRKLNFELDENTAAACRYLWESILKNAQAGTWQCQAPGKVLSTLYKQDDCYYAHFLNATGVNLKKDDVVTVNMPENAFPMIGKDIVFTLPDDSLTVAEAASPDFEGWKKLPLRKVAGGVEITLSKELLKVYAMVRIK